jgi:hypothetical protein
MNAPPLANRRDVLAVLGIGLSACVLGVFLSLVIVAFLGRSEWIVAIPSTALLIFWVLGLTRWPWAMRSIAPMLAIVTWGYMAQHGLDSIAAVLIACSILTAWISRPRTQHRSQTTRV